MTWIKFFESKWFSALFGAGIAIITVFLGHNLSAKWNTNNTIQEELKKRPTFDYVDKQDKITNDYLKQHIDESAKTDEMLTKYILSIDGKINILLSNDRKK